MSACCHAYHGPGTVLRVLHILISFLTALSGAIIIIFITNKETEAQRGSSTFQKVQRYKAQELRIWLQSQNC